MYPVLDSDNPDTTFNVFFNKEEVKAALHAPLDVEWRGCIPGAGRRRLALLANDYPKSVAPYLAFLMDDAKIRILLYNGDRDMSTNAPGVEMVLNGMTEWSGHNAWRRATRGLWIDTENEMAGWAKEQDLLTYLVVYNSGHLVPHNQPARSLELLRRFLSNTTFVDKEIPRITSPELQHTMTHTPVAEGRRRAGTLILGVIALFLAVVGGYEAYARSKRRSYAAVSS
jgi:carboxypeptidase C (cathepsin A)